MNIIDMEREKAYMNIWNAEFTYSANARLVEFVLIGFWNRDGKGECMPTLAKLIEGTHVKSKATIRKSVLELEESGRWVVIRNTGGSGSNKYYPQFVTDPKRFNNINPTEERAKRQALDVISKSK